MKVFSHPRTAICLVALLVGVALFFGCSEIIEVAIQHGGTNHTRLRDFTGTVHLSADQKRIISAVGIGTKVYRGTPSEMASQFLKDNFDLFGLSPSLNDLRVLNERARGVGSIAEFEQTLNELSVENARIQVNFDKEGHVVQVLSSYNPPAGYSNEISVSKEQAAEIGIKEFLRVTPDNPSKDQQQQQQQQLQPGKPLSREELKLTNEPKIDDVYFARNGRLHRAYRISISSTRPFGSKQFVADAKSGEILSTRDFVHNWVDGRGQVFNPNPVNSKNQPGLFDDGDLNDKDFAVPSSNPNPYFTVALPGLTASSSRFTLSGQFVVLENNLESPNTPAVSVNNANNFNFQREPDSFEDVMVYYHIDRMQRYIQSLGFTDILNRPIRADAHGLSGSDNSHYVGTPVGEGFLAFGDGGVDDAEDADVIAHEYGHAVQDNQSRGKFSGIGMPRAMGEGFGDYWAFSSYHRESIANGFDPRCLMEWDGVPNCRRRIDAGPTAASFDPARNEYFNGPIWSHTLFDIFTALNKDTADKLILESHFQLAGFTPTFVDGANAIMTADRLLFSSSHRTALCNVFVARGIYRSSSDCP